MATSCCPPQSITTSVPSKESVSRVRKVNRLTEAILGNASPRNPNVRIPSKSEASRILLVAWRSSASSASSGPIPCPSSLTRIKERPPLSTLTSTFLAPASSAFSTSSFTTDAGRSTTSPAAIRFATTSANRRILWLMNGFASRLQSGTNSQMHRQSFQLLGGRVGQFDLAPLPMPHHPRSGSRRPLQA